MPNSCSYSLALSWSQYLQRQCNANAHFATEIQEFAKNPVSAQTIIDWFLELQTQIKPNSEPSLTQILSIEDCRCVLRRLRNRVLCTLLIRDIAQEAHFDEVVKAMSVLADLCIAQAYRSSAHELSILHGTPKEAKSGRPQEMIILGMGKLGGQELNVSSDVDLILLYAEDGETDGQRSISHHEFYAKVTRKMMPILAELDAEGMVFRTDLRLRPDGDAGALAWSFKALEKYLVTQGREWERYAWLKARVIPAQAFPGSQVGPQLITLEKLRRPFVYRKYLDFNSLAALRSLREQIREDWSRRRHAQVHSSQSNSDNIKLGDGGIREVEFIVQAQQLIRGGTLPSLQKRGLLEALKAEETAELITPHDAELLRNAYIFLRRLEHFLQYYDDQQTHNVPNDPDRKAQLAIAMGYENLDHFEEELTRHRKFVSHKFKTVFESNTSDLDTPSVLHETTETTSNHNEDTSNLSLLLEQKWQDWLSTQRITQLPELSQQKLTSLSKAVLNSALQSQQPEESLSRLLILLDSIAQRQVYLALLTEYPIVIKRVSRIMASSEWATHYLNRHPALLDELIESETLQEEINWQKFQQTLRTNLDYCVLENNQPDQETQMNLMRDMQHQAIFQLLAQDLEGNLSVERLGDHLSLLADILLNEAIYRIWPLVRPAEYSGQAEFAVIAYGKLGGKELGYESDLDIVFVYDDHLENAAAIYAKLVRRLSTWMQSMTSSGRLYELDFRLRPDGDAGLLVSTMESFERYQEDAAWLWEHQALTRARFSAGSTELGKRFETLRHTILTRQRDLDQLRNEIIAMRTKIHETHSNRSDQFDLKHDQGGMVDIEFVTQFLVLAYSHQCPALIPNLGNIALLGIAAEYGFIPQDLAAQVAHAYRAYRKEQHNLRLQGNDKARVDEGKFIEERQAVNALWQQVIKKELI